MLMMGGNFLHDEQLCERLDAVECEHRLGDMYRGAIQALKSSNPDRFAQAAHSLRELVQKLVWLICGEPQVVDAGKLKEKRRGMRKVLSEYGSEVCSKSFKNLLLDLKEYLDLNDDTTRRELIARVLASGSARGVQPEINREKVIEMDKLWRGLERHAHHPKNTDQDKIRKELIGFIKKINENLPRILDRQYATKRKPIKEIQKYDG